MTNDDFFKPRPELFELVRQACREWVKASMYAAQYPTKPAYTYKVVPCHDMLETLLMKAIEANQITGASFTAMMDDAMNNITMCWNGGSANHKRTTILDMDVPDFHDDYRIMFCEHFGENS